MGSLIGRVAFRGNFRLLSLSNTKAVTCTGKCVDSEEKKYYVIVDIKKRAKGMLWIFLFKL